MSDVKQTIQVTNTGLSPILSIAQGTGMVDFEFTISDFQIPAGSTAVAWNIQPTGNIVSQVCTLAGNVITVTPPAYYFLRGKNYMQIQVTGADGVNLFTFLIEVWCSPNISAPVVSQNPDLISQLMAMIGNTQDLDTTAKNNLVAAINEIYGRGVVDILDTEEEIEANTDTGKATGALVTKQLISELAESKKWTLLNVAAELEISQEMINTHEEFLITVVSNDTVLGSIILPAWHSIFQSGEYVGKYLHIGGWYHNAENCGMIQIYKFRDIGWTTNPDLHCCSVNGQYVTVNIALFGR